MVACRLQRLWRMGEQGEKGSDELLILLVSSKYFFFHLCRERQNAHSLWSLRLLNFTWIWMPASTVAWELIRPPSKHVDTQCWRSQLSKWASHRNDGYNLSDHCHSRARTTTSTLKWSPWCVEGTYQAGGGGRCVSFQCLAWIEKQIILFWHAKFPLHFFF